MKKGNVSVVVIDDEESVQKVVAAFAERFFLDRGLKASITLIADPIKALFELSEGERPFPDLVLLDIRMPKISGNAVYRNIEFLKPEYLDRVCFITGYATEVPASDQPLHILKKPFHYREFENAINAMDLPVLQSPAASNG